MRVNQKDIIFRPILIIQEENIKHMDSGGRGNHHAKEEFMNSHIGRRLVRRM